MSTTPPIVPAPAPSKVQTILSIINAALSGLTLVPGLAVPIGIEQAFQSILTNALAAYKAETGLPLDLNKIPQEALVP